MSRKKRDQETKSSHEKPNRQEATNQPIKKAMYYRVSESKKYSALPRREMIRDPEGHGITGHRHGGRNARR